MSDRNNDDVPMAHIAPESVFKPDRFNGEPEGDGEVGREDIDEADVWAVCDYLNYLYKENEMSKCEAFITTHNKAFKTLDSVMSKPLTKVSNDKNFNRRGSIDLTRVEDKDVNESISTSFAAMLPEGFNYLCLAENVRCRKWVGAMFRKHLVARGGVSKLSKMGGGMSLLYDLRRITGMAAITDDVKMLDFLEKKFPNQKGDLKILTANTFSYTDKNVRLPNCPFYAMGLVDNFELSFKVMSEWCFVDEPHKAHKNLRIVAKGFKARYLASKNRANFQKAEALEEALSKSGLEDLKKFAELPFEVVRDLMDKNSRMEANLEAICGRWMHAGMDFTELCTNEVARLVILANFRIHFALRDVPGERFSCNDIMLAAAIANTGDSSLFLYLTKTLFRKRIHARVVSEETRRSFKVTIDGQERAHKEIMKESGTEVYITFSNVSEALTSMNLSNKPEWKKIMAK